jgi:hypothetical protein
MPPSVDQVAEVRRKAAEPLTTNYADTVIVSYIERYPLIDSAGALPDETDWVPTYDLNAAAADIWDEKAAALAVQYDFQADGGSYHRSQAYAQAMQQARYYRSRRAAGTRTLIAVPKNPTPLAGE